MSLGHCLSQLGCRKLQGCLEVVCVIGKHMLMLTSRLDGYDLSVVGFDSPVVETTTMREPCGRFLSPPVFSSTQSCPGIA